MSADSGTEAAYQSVHGLLECRLPAAPANVPVSFSGVGRGQDERWRSNFGAAMGGAVVDAITNDQEDPGVPPEVGVAEAARLLAPGLAETQETPGAAHVDEADA